MLLEPDVPSESSLCRSNSLLCNIQPIAPFWEAPVNDKQYDPNNPVGSNYIQF